MARWIVCLLVLLVNAGVAQASDLDARAFRATIEWYRKSKTIGQLLASHPGFGPVVSDLFEEAHPHHLGDRLEPASFDMNRKIMTVGTVRIEFLDVAHGKFRVNDRPFTWERERNFFVSLRQFNEFMNARKKSAMWIGPVLPEARAQNRDEFPETIDQRPIVNRNVIVQYLIDNAFTPTVAGVGAGLWEAAKTGKFEWVPGVAFVAAASVVDYAVNKAHALIAPSCDEQVATLKRLMTRANISLAGLECGSGAWVDHEQNANISFWTPDQKLLPFYANWETSNAYVDRSKEVYSFGSEKLEKVKLVGRNVSSGEELEKYRARLEPYRQVFFEIGRNNSCFKCEDEIKRALVQSGPQRYPEAPAPAAPATEAKPAAQ